MSKTLFIGNFLSKHFGTKGAVESLVPYFEKADLSFDLVSNSKNKIIRLIEMIFSTIFYKYDIVHVDVYSGHAINFAFIVSKIAKIRGKKVILNLRGGKLAELYNSKKEKLDKLFSNATIILSPSKFLIQFFQSKNIKVEYLPNSIELENFPYNNNIVNTKSILWVRAFNEIYCPEVVIESFQIVKNKFPDATLTMVGPDKGKLNEIKNMIKTLGLDESIKIVGAVPNNKLFKYYQSHSVFLNTTSYESFGVCVAEAASCGTPIISNNVGELPYIWENGVSVFLVDENDPKMFAKNILELFENQLLAEKLKINARQIVENFDRKLIIEKWIKLLGK